MSASTWKRGGGNWRSRAPDPNAPVSPDSVDPNSPQITRVGSYGDPGNYAYQRTNNVVFQQPMMPQYQAFQQPYQQPFQQGGRGQYGGRGVTPVVQAPMSPIMRGGARLPLGIRGGRTASASFLDDGFGERREEREEREEALREALVTTDTTEVNNTADIRRRSQSYDVSYDANFDPTMSPQFSYQFQQHPNFYRGQRGGFARGNANFRTNNMQAFDNPELANFAHMPQVAPQVAFNNSPQAARHYNPRYEGTRGGQVPAAQGPASRYQWGAIEHSGSGEYGRGYPAYQPQANQYQAQYQNVPMAFQQPQFAQQFPPQFAQPGFPYQQQPYAQARPPFERKIEGDHTETVEVAHDKLGLVIGKQGKTIQHIERVCRVLIVKPKRDEPPLFDIRGTKENVTKARVMILSAAYPMSEGNMIKSKPANVVAQFDSLHFAPLKQTPETLGSYDFTYREIYLLEGNEGDGTPTSVLSDQIYLAQFQKDLEEVLNRETPEGNFKPRLQGQLAKMLFANPPEELLQRPFPTEEYSALIESKMIRYSLQTQSLPSDVERIVQHLQNLNSKVKVCEFFDVTGVDEEMKSHFKFVILPDLKLKKAFSKEGRLLVSDILLPGQNHDVRLSFQRGKINEPDEGVVKFISEMQVQKETELIAPATARFHIELIRHKQRTRYETPNGFVVDVTLVTSNELNVVRRRTEVEVTTRKIKDACKANPIDHDQLISLVPELWEAILNISNLKPSV
eukprot:TRINITY_DN486_c0_g1_i1.p1 TRINITY_DN486_c0_g1~~TRINITY_DN486_c0_g1_i1.p1  ORF type:complete len:737 (+),score=235.64 TRINITY_DN486_c0_g1_i1:233-2443(+)